MSSLGAKDALAFKAFLSLGHGWARTLGLGAISFPAATLIALTGSALAIVQRQPRLALSVPAIIGGSVVSAEALKPLAAHHNPYLTPFHLGAASYPSGGSTMAMAMALSAVLIAPPRFRPAVAATGGLFAVGVGLSLLSLGAHLPSEVLGGFFMGGLWASSAVGLCIGPQVRRTAGCASAGQYHTGKIARPRRSAKFAAAVVFGCTVLALAVAVGVRPRPGGTLPEANGALLICGCVIAAAAAGLVSTFMLLLEAPRPFPGDKG